MSGTDGQLAAIRRAHQPWSGSGKVIRYRAYFVAHGFFPAADWFFLDELTLPWGTTLAEAAARLATRPQWPPYGGWPNLRLSCTHALGMATSECNLRALGHARPVLQASYQLAAPSGYMGRPAEASQWQEPLAARLGPPTQAEIVERPEAAGTSMVVYAAHWQWPGGHLSLSAYGGIRPEAGGPVAAGLFLDWEDELAAA